MRVGVDFPMVGGKDGDPFIGIVEMADDLVFFQGKLFFAFRQLFVVCHDLVADVA